MTPTQQAIVDALVAEFTKINEQAARQSPVINVQEMASRYAIQRGIEIENALKKQAELEIKTEMAKRDYEVLTKDLEGTGIKVIYNERPKGQTPYLTVCGSDFALLKHIYYVTGGGNGVHYREMYVGTNESVKAETLEDLMGKERVKNAIYQMYASNQRNKQS